MKIAFIDNSGSLFSVAWTCMEEGHDVAYFTTERETESRKIGTGLVPKVDSLKEIIEWVPDCAVLYNVPGIATRLETVGIENFGSSESGRILESDRIFACELVKQLGIGKCPETRSFRSVNDARQFIKSDGGSRKKWVFKAQGGSSVDVSTTHITNDTSHLLKILDFEEALARAGSFVLQERINGIEISIEGWFHYKTGWVDPINSTLERKLLMPGDLGIATGCMGSIVWGWPQPQPRLFRQTFLQMTQWLTRHKYKGPIDGNFIIDYKDRQPYFLEFTPRIGWNAFEAVMNGFSGNLGEFFVNFSRGTGRKMGFTNTFMGAVRVYAPAHPNIPIEAPVREDPRLFPKDVWSKDRGKTLLTVGGETIPGHSVIFEATGNGATVDEAMHEIYNDVIPQIQSIDIMYRNDIGEKANSDLEMLINFGYIVEPFKRERVISITVTNPEKVSEEFRTRQRRQQQDNDLAPQSAPSTSTDVSMDVT